MQYSGEYTKEISFPLGGIGSGCIGLGGDGRLIDWEIYNQPNKGQRNGYSHIAVKAITDSTSDTRVLNGDMIKDFIGQYNGDGVTAYGLGAASYAMCGFPHFRQSRFIGEFPIARMEFSDEHFPGRMQLTAFNPLIPLDSKNSSIPGAFFEIAAENTQSTAIEYQIAFSVRNPFQSSLNTFFVNEGTSGIIMKHAGLEETALGYGDLTIATDCSSVLHQTYWYRGEWKDPIVSFWNDFTADAEIQDRHYAEPGQQDTCTLVARLRVAPGQVSSAHFVLTWNVPNNFNYWDPYKDADGQNILWKNYYATVFKNSAASAVYSLQNWAMLYSQTALFRDSLFASTVDPAVLDAVSANLAVLKSPTVLRLEDGSFYGWEGVFERGGSCEGTCQHVWNYAYALCFLFPDLERSIRDAELRYGTMPDGKTVFRLKLPYGREPWGFRACLDGQMGLVFKCYREWKLSGDDSWLRQNWEKLQKILAYAWSEANPDEWDRNRDGVLEGRQHHTLDMELYGPSAWLEGMYLLALRAAAEMAEYLGERDKAADYTTLFEKGRAWTGKELFNGEYFTQKLDLKDQTVLAHFGEVERYWNKETGEIKYQIGDGSSIDQLLGEWHARLLGLGDIFDPQQVRTALSSMMKYNFRPSLREFANPWRVFSLNDEAGAIICAYPDHRQKPSIPLPYCEETMSGFEYAFAGLLIAYGMVEEGLQVVRAIRSRYNGKTRNPWSEIECGSNYARSMASYALLPLLGGFSYDLPHGHLGFAPVIKSAAFSTFWCAGTAWGNFHCQRDVVSLDILHGALTLSSFALPQAEKAKKLEIDGKAVAFDRKDSSLHFSSHIIRHSLHISLA